MSKDDIRFGDIVPGGGDDKQDLATRLIEWTRVLLVLFIMYIVIDGFGQVIGFNLPGGV